MGFGFVFGVLGFVILFEEESKNWGIVDSKNWGIVVFFQPFFLLPSRKNLQNPRGDAKLLIGTE